MPHALGTVEFSFENNQTKSPVRLKGFYMYGISRYLFALTPPFRDANIILVACLSMSRHRTIRVQASRHWLNHFARYTARFWG